MKRAEVACLLVFLTSFGFVTKCVTVKLAAAPVVTPSPIDRSHHDALSTRLPSQTLRLA